MGEKWEKLKSKVRRSTSKIVSSSKKTRKKRIISALDERVLA